MKSTSGFRTLKVNFIVLCNYLQPLDCTITVSNWSFMTLTNFKLFILNSCWQKVEYRTGRVFLHSYTANSQLKIYSSAWNIVRSKSIGTTGAKNSLRGKMFWGRFCYMSYTYIPQQSTHTYTCCTSCLHIYHCIKPDILVWYKSHR